MCVSECFVDFVSQCVGFVVRGEVFCISNRCKIGKTNRDGSDTCKNAFIDGGDACMSACRNILFSASGVECLCNACECVCCLDAGTNIEITKHINHTVLHCVCEREK